MVDLFVHVGYPKTATTTFQRHVFPHHSQIEYLGKFVPGYGYVDDIVGAGINRLIMEDDTRYRGVELLRERLTHHRSNSGRLALLISSESFVQEWATDRGLVARRLHAACGPCKIIFTIREQLAIIRSFFGLHGRFGQYLFLAKSELERARLPLSMDDWLKFTFRAFDKNFLSTILYHETIDYYCRVFGSENVGVFLFEELQINKVEYVNKLCSFMGVDTSEALALLGNKRELPSLSKMELFKLKLFAYLGVQYEYDMVTDSRMGIPPLMSKLLGNATVKIPASWLPRLIALYRSGNRALMEQYGLPLDKFNYCV